MKIFNKTITFLSLLMFLFLIASCQTEKHVKTIKNKIYADKVLKNGKIYTFGIKNQNAEALAIKNGKILFIGTNEEVENFIGSNTKVDDLKGKTVLPSFIDSHTHPGLVAMTSGNSELAKYNLPTTSKEDMYNYLKKIAKENPNLPYLMIGTWSNPLWGVKDPDRKEIDDIFPKTIVILR